MNFQREDFTIDQLKQNLLDYCRDVMPVRSLNQQIQDMSKIMRSSISFMHNFKNDIWELNLEIVPLKANIRGFDLDKCQELCKLEIARKVKVFCGANIVDNVRQEEEETKRERYSDIEYEEIKMIEMTNEIAEESFDQRLLVDAEPVTTTTASPDDYEITVEMDGQRETIVFEEDESNSCSENIRGKGVEDATVDEAQTILQFLPVPEKTASSSDDVDATVENENEPKTTGHDQESCCHASFVEEVKDFPTATPTANADKIQMIVPFSPVPEKTVDSPDDVYENCSETKTAGRDEESSCQSSSEMTLTPTADEVQTVVPLSSAPEKTVKSPEDVDATVEENGSEIKVAGHNEESSCNDCQAGEITVSSTPTPTAIAISPAGEEKKENFGAAAGESVREIVQLFVPETVCNDSKPVVLEAATSSEENIDSFKMLMNRVTELLGVLKRDSISATADVFMVLLETAIETDHRNVALVVDEIARKAFNEDNDDGRNLYVELCSEIIKKTSINNNERVRNLVPGLFRRRLIDTFLAALWDDDAQRLQSTTPDESTMDRPLNASRFLIELFKRKLLNLFYMMTRTISKLVKCNDACSLECLCVLLAALRPQTKKLPPSNRGKELSIRAIYDQLEQYALHGRSADRDLPERTISKINDLLRLKRKN